MQTSQNSSKEDTKGNLSFDEGVQEKSSETLNPNAVEETPPDIFVESPMEVMPTLPKTFKSLVDIPIEITDENREPQNIIQLLGDILGVDDYQTNMASFWFLDFIALQVLQNENKLNSNGRSIMVSWLAGEMKLIQENNLTREAFFQQMSNVFLNSFEKLERGYALLHWDLMMMGEHRKEEIAVQEEAEAEAKKPTEMSNVSSTKMAKRRVSSRGDKKSANRKKISDNSLQRQKKELEKYINENDKDTLKFNFRDILDVIVDATYCMYGDNFHYALIIAAFVEPVKLYEYTLPYTLPVPRPLKMYKVEKQEKKTTTKGQNSVAAPEKKEINKKSKDKIKKKSKDRDSTETTVEPPKPAILTEDEMLAKKREFILPLMESNEAPSILKAYEESKNRSKNVKGQKKKL